MSWVDAEVLADDAHDRWRDEQEREAADRLVREHYEQADADYDRVFNGGAA